MLDSLKPYLQKIEEQISSLIDNQDSWASAAFGNLYAQTKKQHTDFLLEPASALVSLGGKRWRPLLLVLTAQALLENRQDLSQEKKQELMELAYHLSPLVEAVHTASLIHDDIEDKSTERRGKPAAYITYGLDAALNSGSWFYFMGPQTIDTANCSIEQKNLLYKHFNQEVRRLHLGQAMDIMWHSQPSLVPTDMEYMAMVQYKTGTLSSLACKTGALAAGASEQLSEQAGLIAAKIGAGFQIIDDVINLTTGNPGKKRGDDIVEGKKSLPVLLFCQNADNQQKLKLLSLCATAQKEGIDSPVVEQAIQILLDSGSVESAHIKGKTLIKEGCMELRTLLGSGPATELITGLFNSMIPEIKC